MSLNRKTVKVTDRLDIVKESEIKEAATGVVPKNTKKNTMQATQNLSDWFLNKLTIMSSTA